MIKQLTSTEIKPIKKQILHRQGNKCAICDWCDDCINLFKGTNCDDCENCMSMSWCRDCKEC